MNFKVLLFITCVVLFSCKNNSMDIPGPKESLTIDPIFTNSITATDIDFITEADPSSFISLQYLGQGQREMPDKRKEELMDDSTYVFQANFSDSNQVELWLHSSFGSRSEAETYARLLTAPIGKLPSFMRNTLLHVVVHQGNETAFGESEGHFFVVYSENMRTRIDNHDLEETVFHESVHATLDSKYLKSNEWQQAQISDDTFITEYAKNNPNKEDMAETALFVYTMIQHSDRLSTNTVEWINKNIPNRVAFLRSIFD